MHKVLIANRGEIAVRIARACRDEGLRSVAVYAEPDADALHVRMADEAWALRGSRPADSYLHIEQLLDIARRSGADAVHPGYGFLSERADFAQAVIDARLTWIGPPPATIAALGDKVQARRIAQQVGAPLVQGTDGPVASAAQAVAFARQHGLPVAIKAAHGGGGRGLKVAWQLDEVPACFEAAVREATAAFGRGECFVEQYIERPRHIEVQVLADQHGQVQVLGTRDCSLQRRHQKLLEEAPAPHLSDAQRQQLHRAAHDICHAAGYVGAGTVEFLLSRSGQLSFLEVNTRLQVEHPVTEETTGIDLVAAQLRIAQGQRLPSTATPTPRGHSIELRINAEDPARGFLPAPGRITRWQVPSGPGVRVDSGVAQGSCVPAQYDSLLAKLIVTGSTREQAIARARRALQEWEVQGVPTVLPFHQAVLEHPDFVHMQVHTRWIEADMPALTEAQPRGTPADAPPLAHVWIELDGKRMRLGLPAAWQPQLGGSATSVPSAQGVPPHAGAQAGSPAGAEVGTPAPITAPMAGSLLAWKVQDGECVAAGHTLAVLEAMKMETPVLAPHAGRVQRLVAEGAAVAAGQGLVHMLPLA